MEARAYDVFICFAEPEAKWVRGYLLPGLSGLRVLTEKGFALGAPRLTEFENGVTRSARTVLVLSPAFVASGFEAFAGILAQSVGIEAGEHRVIPLIRREVRLPAALGALTALQMTRKDQWDDGLGRLRTALEAPPPGPPKPPPCPYPGLTAFSSDQAGRFFGREDEIDMLARRVRTQSLLEPPWVLWSLQQSQAGSPTQGAPVGEGRQIPVLDRHPVMRRRDHAAPRAADQDGAGLNADDHLRLGLLHAEYAEPGQAEHRLGNASSSLIVRDLLTVAALEKPQR